MAKEKEKSTNEEPEGVGSGFNVVLAVVLGFIIWVLFKSNQEKDVVISSLKKVNNDIKSELTKINIILDQADGLTKEAKVRIQKLIDRDHRMEEGVKSELMQAFILIQSKMVSKALFAMGKIIENSLKTIFGTDAKFKEKYKGNRFVDLIQFAKDSGVLDRDEFHFTNGIRELRNSEAHQLDVKKDSSWEVNSVILATTIIMKLEDRKPKGLAYHLKSFNKVR